MSYLIKKELSFDAAHRLLNYQGKCKDLHGHTYKVVVELLCKQLDNRAIGVDFGLVKSLMQTWLNNNWDHNVILHVDDPLLSYLAGDPEYRTPYIMRSNPTAEAMADFLSERFSQILYEIPVEGVSVYSVEVFETPTSSCQVKR